ncbi:hypothetical protein ACFS27_00955 [Promicromonospora vindobonensis]|uniref:Methane monooxygenase PmoA-like n=1 Tax=Promicromonospora vindobonensis TaxID=195748 RepID=A0ABW5VKG9_9MICO
MTSTAAPVPPDPPHPPEVADGWLRPASEVPAEPRWGFADGLQVGLHPLRGPRGLLRVYAPYLGHPRDRLLNFIAVEPIPHGATERGYSELEHSALDDAPGKRFWSADGPEDPTPRDPLRPARGVVEEIGGVEHLTVHVHSEGFENGAEVVVRVRFRADRPHEVSVAAALREGSVPLRSCVLTATMGNFARLRRLHLRERVVTPGELWPGFTGTGFAAHGVFGRALLAESGGAVSVWATPDEAAPHDAEHSADTAEHWRYLGEKAVQGWRVPEPSDALEVLVNGRWAYWASAAPIPGGVSYENFEVVEPFRDQQELVYWVEPFRSDADVASASARHLAP